MEVIGSSRSCFIASSLRTIFIIILVVGTVTSILISYYTQITTATATFFTNQKAKNHPEYFNLSSVWNETKLSKTGKSETVEKQSAAETTTDPALYLVQTNRPRNLTEQKPDLKFVERNIFSNQASQETGTPHKRTKVINKLFSTQNLDSTTMTFNNTLNVSCMESPFIDCGSDVAVKNLTTKKTFSISLFRMPSWLSQASFSLSLCQFSACKFSKSKPSNDTDAVLVYGVRLPATVNPPRRWENQIYAISTWESPVHIKSDFLNDGRSIWNSQINLTMSYRVDSDIFVPYAVLSFAPKLVSSRPDYYEIAKNKTRTAVWIVSHCYTHSKREQYVKEMRSLTNDQADQTVAVILKYVDVDIFDKCGQPCQDATCKELSRYRFYLAFENSLCTDYITEKFFKLFDPGIHVIPVVRGGADYDKYFPNFTHINAAHFKTAKDLALHLKDLASDLKTYSKYLEYKDLYTINYKRWKVGCLMCEYLHTRNAQEHKTYNLTSWLGYGQCKNPKDI